jgi:hypothetical protein
MTCHTRRDETAAQPDSTQPDPANAVRLLSDLLETRKVALRLRRPGETTDKVYAAEVLCDLPGGRALTRIVGTSVAFWAAQSSTARLVVAEVK